MGASAHLSALIACRTVSATPDAAEFARFRGTLAELYPRTHAEIEYEVLPGGSLLYRWHGASSDRPLLLMAHHDVVPAPVSGWAENGWLADPFAGEVIDGAVYGRGALDDKGALVCIFEAVEQLLVEGFTPARDVLLFSGADEETLGSGAKTAAQLLTERGITPWLVSDEGGAIVEPGMLPGTPTHTAAVAVAEKGTVDVQLVARSLGGHSSMPLPGGATERLAEAVLRVSRFEPGNTTPEALRRMLENRRPHLDLELARAMNGHDEQLARVVASQGPELDAMTRTTMVVTRLDGSEGDNVLATTAKANINVRLVPGDTIDALVQRLERLLHGLDVQIARVSGDDPSPTAPSEGAPWELLNKAIHAVDPALDIVPYLQSGSTDSRYFTDATRQVYRFAPLVMHEAQRRSVHGINEHVAIDALERGIAFPRTLITENR